MRPFLTALPLALLPLLAPAQSPTGSMTGTLDLVPVEWTIVTEGEGPVSGWQTTDAGMRVTIVGVPNAEAEAPSSRLVLEFTTDGGADMARAGDPALRYTTPDGEDLTADPVNIDLTLNATALEGEGLVLAGDLFAVLTPDDPGGVAISPEDGVTFDGNFVATIPEMPGA